MDAIKRQHILDNCNELSVDQILTLINENHLTIEDFKNSGLRTELFARVQELEKLNLAKEISQKQSTETEQANKQLIQEAISGERGADFIENDIRTAKYTFDDLQNHGYDKDLLVILKRYISEVHIIGGKPIHELPPMDINRTDLYLIGVAGTGKSTILGSLFKQAVKKGVLIPDTYNIDGSIYQNALISNLNKGVLPKATATNTYHYVACSLQDSDLRCHPFNVVDVPGELFKSIYENGEVESFLKYINNPNKKILAFIIDSLAHDSGYSSKDQIDQSLIYVNILQMFKQKGVLEEVDAIYLVVNKFDAIKESRYKNNEDDDVLLAHDFLHDEFLYLVNNCKSARDDTKNKFKIKVLPFSIGEVSNSFLFKNFNGEYPSNLIDELLEDSFIIKQKKTGFFR